MTAGSGKRLYLLALLPFLVLAGMFEIVPVITIVVQSFLSSDGGGFTLANYGRIFSKQLYRSQRQLHWWALWQHFLEHARHITAMGRRGGSSWGS